MSKNNETEESDDVEFVDLGENIKNSPKQNLNLIESKQKTKYSPFRSIHKMQGHSTSRKQKKSRRKTIHTVIHENDEILFESYPKLTDLSLHSNQKGIKKMPKLVPCKTHPYNKKENNMESSSKCKRSARSSGHPAIEYMQRIAFLKACINYMLISVEKDAINFEETGITLSKLFKAYKISQPESEVIGID